MEELELLRQKALALINDPNQNPDTMMKGSDLLKRVEEIENSRLSTQKLRKDLSEGRVVEIVKILAPYATVLILAATLGFQFWQQRKISEEKSRDRDEALWADALRSVSDGHSLEAIIKLKYFETSDNHREDAGQLVLSLFRHSRGFEDFKELFEGKFSDVTSSNLGSVLDVDRALHSKWVDLNNREELDPNSRATDDGEKLDTILELSYICTKAAPVLKNRSDKPFDLHFVAVFDCDLSYADLRDANLDGFVSARVDMSGAKLCGARIDHGYWKDTMWWQVDSVSPDSLAYLKGSAFSPEPIDHYRRYPRTSNNLVAPTQQQYDEAVNRLASPGHNCQ